MNNFITLSLLGQEMKVDDDDRRRDHDFQAEDNSVMCSREQQICEGLGLYTYMKQRSHNRQWIKNDVDTLIEAMRTLFIPTPDVEGYSPAVHTHVC